MGIYIKNAKIMTMEKGFEIITGGILIENSVVKQVGNVVYDTSECTVIDAKGNLIMPSFKNAHTHSGMTFARSCADDLPLHEWLFNRILPIEKNLEDGDVYYLSQIAFMEYLASGCTACFDMYSHTDDLVNAALDTGFRTVICDSINDFGGTIKQMRDDYKRYNAMGPLVGHRIGLHAQYTTELSLIKDVAKLANELQAPFYSHNSETADEVKQCVESFGMTPTALFESLGAYNYGGGGFHCVYFNDEDIDIFKRRGLCAITCPGSNSKLASGIAPLCDFARAGVKIAIGTDGAGSNNALNMFREMYLAAVLQKLRYSDAGALDALELLYAATAGGANAMGIDAVNLLPGSPADLIVIDLNRANMQPYNDIAKNLVYSGGAQNIKLTMVNGKILYRDGEFLTIDRERVYFEAGKINQRLHRA